MSSKKGVTLIIHIVELIEASGDILVTHSACCLVPIAGSGVDRNLTRITSFPDQFFVFICSHANK